jgi:hypothetical protein
MTTTSLVLVETAGTLKALKAKDLTAETLYKKCGFRASDDFIKQHTWQVKLKGQSADYRISLWAKTVGKANFENKYDFPPPVDKTLFFGTCALVHTDAAGHFLDLTTEVWLKIYEHLFGGFEDLGEEDEYSEDELANVDPSLLTANGYLKDGFVVSDTETLSQADTISPPLTPPPKKSKGAKVVKDKKAAKAAKPVKDVKEKAPGKKKNKALIPTPPEATESDTDDSAETTSELEEEVYTYSDEE